MKSSPDTAELAKQALGAATSVARNGGARSRAGRFDELDALKVVARQVQLEATAALESWLQWEAINNECSNPEISEHAELFGGLGQIRLSLARDAILTCARLTDQSQPDRMTLTRFATALHDPQLANILTSREWALDLGHLPFVADSSALANRQRVNRLSAVLVADWEKGKSTLKDNTLLNLRSKVRAIRNRVLAHSLGLDASEHLNVNEHQELINLVFDLSCDASLLFTGNCSDRSAVRHLLKQRADQFWAAALGGILLRAKSSLPL